MKHSPGCNCCECTIAGETFTFADGSDLDTDVTGWTVWDTDCVTAASLGTSATVQGNILETTSSDLKATPTGSGLIYEWIAQVDVKGDDEGDELDLLAWAPSGGDRCYNVVLRLTVSDTCPLLSIIYLEDTVTNPDLETVLREIPLPDAAVGEWHRLKACVLDAPVAYPYGGSNYNTRFFCTITTNLGTVRHVMADVVLNDERGLAGIGTGAITTKAYFDNFDWSFHQGNGDGTTSLSCPRCRVDVCQYAEDDFANGIDCVWDQSYTSPDVFDAPVTAHVSYTTMRGTYPAGGAPRIRHKIGNPYNRPFNVVTVWFLIENEGDTIGICPIADEGTGNGPTIFFTAGAVDSDCGYLQFLDTSAPHLPVPALGPDVWVHARVCYGWDYWGTGKILSVVVNDEDSTKRVRYSQDAVDYDTDDNNNGVGGVGPYWYASLIYAAGTSGNEVHFRDFTVSLSYSADPQLTGSYGYARHCPKCYEPTEQCLWTSELCVGAFEDCLILDSGTWSCTSGSCGLTILRGASASERIWQIPNPHLSTNHRVEGIVTSNGESDQTVMICYDQDSGDYLGLKFTWDDTCGKVEIIENGTAIRTMESANFTPDSVYQFCFQYANGFCYAWARSYDLGACEPANALTRHTVVLQVEVTANAGGIWCGAKTGTWVDGGTVADFYDLQFFTARSTEFPECEPCSECNVAVNATGGCDVTGLTTSTPTMLVAGETATLAFASLEEPNVTADFAIDCTDYSQSATFTLGPHSITITASTGAGANNGTITTSEGDNVTNLSLEPGVTLADMASFAARICVDGTTVRFVVGQALASYYPSASSPWTNTATMEHTGPSDAGWSAPTIYFKSCEECGTLCDSCDNGYLPETATLDATFSTGLACCDSFDGIYYIEMDGCSGVSDTIVGSGDCRARWTITLTQYTGYVRVMAELYLQDPYPNPGVYFYWKYDAPSIVDPSLPGVVDCTSLGRMTLDYYTQDLDGHSTQCSPAGVSSYIGTQIYLEIA